MGALDSALSFIPFGKPSFVQDSIKNFQKKGFPESLFCSFCLIQPAVPNDSPNENETISARRWPIAC